MTRAPISLPGQTVIFDYGEVISLAPSAADREVIADLAGAGGTRLALLSNAGPDFGSYFRHGPLGGFFAACYVSGELNLLKPHPAIYRHVLDDLGISAADVRLAVVDEDGLRGAEALGITSHVFTGVATLRAFLTSLA